jgi:hypothetical protein
VPPRRFPFPGVCTRSKGTGKYSTNQRNHRPGAATESSPSRSAGCLSVRSIAHRRPRVRLAESSRARQLAPHVWVTEVGTRRPGASKEQRPGARSSPPPRGKDGRVAETRNPMHFYFTRQGSISLPMDLLMDKKLDSMDLWV